MKCLLCQATVGKDRLICDDCHLNERQSTIRKALKDHVENTIRPILESTNDPKSE